jgi:orotidine-5'-phosphate decarboxylase
LRARFPHVPFLVPGLGAQGGSFETLRQYFDANGYGAIVNASRSVMYPQPREQDLFSNVRKACADFISSVRDVITNAR